MSPARFSFGRSAAALAVLMSALASSARTVVDVSAEAKAAMDGLRPNFHFQAAKNWINDPCAPYYDQKTGLYHVFYQHNPYGPVWGNMTWGHAVSRNLISWVDLPHALSPTPNSPDDEGVFTGQVVPVGYKGLPTVYYTGASGKISWSQPYTRGSEKVVMATSEDGGLTWTKRPAALLNGPPEQYDVHGWRDPYLFTSPELDRRLEVPEGSAPTQYMTVSGSEREQGGRLFLYSSQDWVYWQFKGMLFAPELEEPTDASDSSGKEWTGSFGKNFEVANFFTLKDEDGNPHNFITVGTEGGRGATHDNHWSLWVSGEFSNAGDGRVTLTPTARGIADAGRSYASNSFWDPKVGRQVAYGWIGEDMDSERLGWAGTFTLPREHFVATYRHVFDPHDRLAGAGPFKVSDGPVVGGQRTKVVTTLGVRPVREVEALRDGGAGYTHQMTVEGTKKTVERLPVKGKFYEAVATAEHIPADGRVGFVVRHTDDMSERTLVYYDHGRGRVVVDRERSSKAEGVVKTEESGKFELFDIACDASLECVKLEKLELRVFVDSSVLEVYANGRFALSTRIYPTEGDAVHLSTYSKNGAAFGNVTVYNDFKFVFPRRDAPGPVAKVKDFDVPLGSASSAAVAPPEWAGLLCALSAAALAFVPKL